MADTTNFGWTKPTVSGSSGAWGTILNTLFDDIDTDLQKVFTENLHFPILSAGMHAVHIGDDPEGLGETEVTFYRTPDGLFIQSDAGTESHTFMLPISGLAAGMKFTGFKSRGQAPTGTIVTVALRYVTNTGVENVVSSGHSHTTSLATLTVSGLSTAIIADVEYYFHISISRSSGTNEPFLGWCQPVVARV